MPSRRDCRRWGLCFLGVLVTHLGFATGLMHWQRAPAAVGMPAASIVIDMVTLAPAPQPSAPAPQPEPEPEPEPPPVPKPAVTLPKPEPQPPAPAPPPRPQATVTDHASPAPLAAAPQQAPASSAAAEASWQGLLLAHLERHKRYPHLARKRHQQGTVLLRFAVDAEGRVLHWQVERSSGHGLLDAETQALVQRAQPLPPPPPELAARAPLELVVPVEFSIR